MKSIPLLGAIVFVMLCMAPRCFAQQAMSAEQMQQALARAQGLLRQVAEQKAALEAELAGLKVAQAGMEKKLRITELRLEERDGELSATRGREQSAQARAQSTATHLEKTRAQLAEVVDKYNQLAARQRETESARQQLEANLDTTAQALEDAQARNLELYRTAQELAARYDGKTAWDALAQHEPLTGLRKVEMQNRLQEFESRLFDGLTDRNVESVRAADAAGGDGEALNRDRE